MYFSTAYKIEFELDGKTHRCTVDRLYLDGHRPKAFFRVGAISGNRDLICHDGQWLVISGPPLRDVLVDAIGSAIEVAVAKSL